jgi:Fic family protein
VTTARRLVKLAETDRDRIASLGRGSSALRIHHALQQRPVANAAQIAKRTKLSMPAISRVLAALEEIGLVREITGRQRNRVFSYAGYVRILSEGTEPMRG